MIDLKQIDNKNKKKKTMIKRVESSESKIKIKVFLFLKVQQVFQSLAALQDHIPNMLSLLYKSLSDIYPVVLNVHLNEII